MRYHLIAVGGAAMHNMALALKEMGHEVSGSDDQIFEPSKSRLDKAGLLPAEMGWNPERISADIDGIILGMHAREGNPELEKAKALNIPIYSYPEFIYNQAKDKTRVVIGGSHGKTSITAMVLHVLHDQKMDFDYMVGAQLEGFQTMVKLSDAPVIILEGDEYLSSPIDRRPKFHWYKPQIAVLSGIAWDHINVFPTFENYVDQFRIFAETVTEHLFFADSDKHLSKLFQLHDFPAQCSAYGLPKFEIVDGSTIITHEEQRYEMLVFGEHNLYNMQAARQICKRLGISDHTFYQAMCSFKGAARRLELMAKKQGFTAYKDFAHSPSKVAATTKAVRDQFPERKFLAILELHTFSSLNAEFLSEYAAAMDSPDKAMVYFNPETIKHKKLEAISKDQVRDAFQREDLEIYTDSDMALADLKAAVGENTVVLLMSSGNFNGNDIDAYLKSLAD